MRTDRKTEACRTVLVQHIDFTVALALGTTLGRVASFTELRGTVVDVMIQRYYGISRLSSDAILDQEERNLATRETNFPGSKHDVDGSLYLSRRATYGNTRHQDSRRLT